MSKCSSFYLRFFFSSLNLIHVHSNSENTLDFMRRAYILVTHTRVYEFFFLLIFCHLHNETLQLLASTELELILCCMLWRAQCLTVYYSSSLFTFRLTEEERTFGKRNIEHHQQQNVKSHTLSLGMGLHLGRDIRMIYTMKCVQVI